MRGMVRELAPSLLGVLHIKPAGVSKWDVGEVLEEKGEGGRVKVVLNYKEDGLGGWVQGVKSKGLKLEAAEGCLAALVGETYSSGMEGHASCSDDGPGSIAKQYLEHGLESIEKLDGPFVLVLVDHKKQRILLFRDRLGFRPLYYSRSGEKFAFSIKLDSVLFSLSRTDKVSLESINLFLSYGYIPGPHTTFRGVRQVRPGHVLIVENGSVTERPYWRFRYPEVGNRWGSGEDTITAFRDTFFSAVSRRLERHPDAGAFLSGGLDTSIVAAVMKEVSGKKFKVFTAGFEEEAYDETEDARIVADHLGLDFHNIRVRFDKNFPDLLEKIVLLHEAPFADTSAIPSYFAAKLAREHVETVFTGDFPDQLIGGSGHQVTALQREANDPVWKRRMRGGLLKEIVTRIPLKAGGAGVLDKVKRFLYREAFPLEEQRILLGMPVPPLLKRALYSPDMLEVERRNDPLEVARQIYDEVKEESLLNKILYFDTLSYAPDDLMVKVNRMTEAHGLNAISPFHDREVVEFVAALPEELKINGQERKVILRRAFGHMLPDHTLRKRKQGFAMPIGEWLVRNLADYVRDVLLDSRTLNRGYFNKKFMRKMVEDFLAGKTDYASGSESTIICLLTLELWHRLFIDR